MTTNDADGFPWGTAWTQRVGAAVRALRRQRRLSAQQVADLTTELGFTVPRNTIANLETGRRKGAISIQEIAVLAAALGVPPVEMLYLDTDEHVEILPGVSRDAFRGAQWFSGLETLNEPEPDASGTWLTHGSGSKTRRRARPIPVVESTPPSR